jgi:hypothetical protein
MYWPPVVFQQVTGGHSSIRCDDIVQAGERCGSPSIETGKTTGAHHVYHLPEAALSEPEATDAGIDGEDGPPPGSR